MIETCESLPEIILGLNFNLALHVQPAFAAKKKPILGILFLEDHNKKTHAVFMDFDKLRFYDNRSYLSVTSGF